MDVIYEKAVAIWLARKYNLDADKISDIDFTTVGGGGCETCWYETFGIEFRNKGKLDERELGTTSAGQFIQECSEILQEIR